MRCTLSNATVSSACVGATRQADAAAARGAFQHHRIADALGLRQRLAQAGQQAGARRHRHAGFGRQFTRAVLQAELADLLRRGADEGDARGFAGVGELGRLSDRKP